MAILHDVVEDTSVTPDDLRRDGFPPEVLDALACVTKTHENEDYEAFVRRAASDHRPPRETRRFGRQPGPAASDEFDRETCNAHDEVVGGVAR
jgi:hypothetical protein